MYSRLSAFSRIPSRAVRRRIRALAVVAVVAFAGNVSFLAAQEGGTASLTGVVSDELGGVLPGVTITAVRAGGDLTRETVSDGAGRYAIAGLPPGAYEVEATLAGFQGRAATVEVGAAGARADLTLAIAPLAETVTVTRSDRVLSTVPNAVAVVGGDDIDFTERKSSLDEVLRGIPGLLVQNRRNYGLSGGIGLSIRAPQPRFGLRGLAIIQDGIPITTADGTTEPGNVDLGSVRRIEVIRGPSSVLYGNSAGGVISLFTEIDQTRRLTVSPSTQFGSYGYQRHQMRVDGHNDSGTRFMGSYSRFRTDGWRQHSAAEIGQTNIVVRQAIASSTDISGIFNHYDAPFAESPSFLTAAQAGDPRLPAEQLVNANPRQARPFAGATVAAQNWGESARQGQGGVTLEHRFAGTQTVRATGWAARRKLDAGGVGRVIDLGREAAGVRSEYLGATEAGDTAITWTAGVDVASQDDDRMEFGFRPPFVVGGTEHRGALQIDQQEEVLSAGPFAQVSVAPHPRVTVTAGVRYDYYRFRATDRKLDDGDQSGERTMGAASPSVGVTVAATSNLNLYGNFATAYETPTTVELSNTPDGTGGFNQLLDPERLRSAEVGIRGLIEPARLQYDIAYYRARVLGALVPFQRADEQTFFDNAGESARNGVELSLDWQPVSRVRARLAYTRQDFTFAEFVLRGTDYSGNLEPGAPPNRMFAGIDYATPFGLRSSLTVRWVDEFFLTNANAAEASNWAYTVVDLRFGWDASLGGVDVRPFLGIDNLLSERYNSSAITNAFGRRYYEPSPGREIYGGITLGGGLR